jgi:biotin carboxylase
MSIKKILFLGGSKQQYSIISLAKKKKYYVIICDANSHCHGKKYADKFFNVSITNKLQILKIAKQEKISAIISYASELGALTQSFVANKLKLPTNKLKSIEILIFKNKFRSFLKKNKFFVPKFKAFKNFNDLKLYLKNKSNYHIIKPIDSAGSRGVFKINNKNLPKLKKNFLISKKFSKKNKVICEEYIKTDLPQIAGDAIILNKKIIFSHWGDQYYDKTINPLLPIGESWPSSHNEINIFFLEKELNRLFKKLKISFGVFNFDIRFTENKKLMIIEIGPRNGGDYIAEVVKDATGVDMIEQTLNLYLGLKIHRKKLIKSKNISCASLRIGAPKSGYLKNIEFSNELKKLIYKKYLIKKKNDFVKKFNIGNNSLGNIFFRFKNFNQMIRIMNSINKYIKVIIR